MGTARTLAREWILSTLLHPRQKPGDELLARPSCSLGVSSGGRERALVDRRLEVHVASERDRVGEREDLGRPEPADAVFAVDPVEEVGEARPAQLARRPSGGRVLV